MLQLSLWTPWSLWSWWQEKADSLEIGYFAFLSAKLISYEEINIKKNPSFVYLLLKIVM